MASKSSFLPRLSLGGNGSPILPIHHQRSKSNDYDLSELSPRPSSPLLSPDNAHDFGFRNSLTCNGNGNTNSNSNHKGKGRGRANFVAYPSPEERFAPISVVDRMRLHPENQITAREREPPAAEQARRTHNGPSWKPPSPSGYHDDAEAYGHHHVGRGSRQSRGNNLGASFIGFLNPAPSTIDRNFVGEVDNTFRTIQHRERQIQKELQSLLDAQASALDQGGPSNAASEGGDTPRGSSRASASPYLSRSASSYEGSPAPAVIPVRQPRPKPLTIRQVRLSIARSMAMLSDLKEEEDAYIVAAISARKTALARANKLSRQHKAIAADLRALETDDPLRRELEGMNNEHGKICGDIQEIESKLRALKHRQRVLEARMEEVKSERESGMSGYRGALRETERDIGEMMRIPGVKVLSAEEASQVSQADALDETAKQDLLERALSGHEFMRMRPERRTIAMAKEWWGGEMALLSRHKEVVDTERDALSEGSEIWVRIVQLITEYERRLATALSGSLQIRRNEHQRLEAELFQGQYRDLQRTIRGLETELHYVEEKGWNLLVAAVGAELEGFMEGENILAGLMQAKGYELPRAIGLLDLNEEQGNGRDETDDIAHAQSGRGRLENQEDDELTGSVVRRWGGQSETRTSPAPHNMERTEADTIHHNGSPQDLLANNHDHRDESDNEVPADLLVSGHHIDESEDEHVNEVPAEFLSMHHAPQGKSRQHEQKPDEDSEFPKDLMADIAAGTRDDGVD